MAARITLRVIPRARRNEIAGRRGEALVVRLQAPPVEGAANEALARYLADRLGVRPSQVRIVSGGKARDKVVEIEGLAQDEAERLLTDGP
jgi:uncharacterized protein